MYSINRILRSLLTLIIDGIFIILAFLSAYYVRSRSPFFIQTKETPLYPYLEILPIVCVISLFSLQYIGLYKNQKKPIIDLVPGIFMGSLISTFLLILITFFFKTYPYSRVILLLFFLFNFIYLMAWRGIHRLLMSMLYRKGLALTGVIIVGTGKKGRYLGNELSPASQTGYEILGYISEMERETSEISDSNINILGSISDLEKILIKYNCQEIFITLQDLSSEILTEWTYLCSEHGIQLHLFPNLQEIIAQNATLTEYRGIPIIQVEGQAFQLRNRILKRTLDIFLSALLLMLLSPVMVLIGLLIKFSSSAPGPVFYRHTRVGRKGQLFEMYKFRSMVMDADRDKAQYEGLNIAQGPLFKIPNDPRITPMGRFLRRWSLDELPQLFNVLKNDMSLVGPRPPLQDEVKQYEPWQMKRLQIQPGITGLWQVSGRSDLPFDEMVKLDIYYIEHWSLWMDSKILLKTLWAVVKGKGAY